MSAVVIRAENEPKTEEWVEAIIRGVDQHQIKTLHFRELRSNRKKLLACFELAHLDVRLFIMMSHKKNMENYRNKHAELARVNKTAWFYVWCTKLLMEEVTLYVERRSIKDHGSIRRLRIEFSETGGVVLDDVRRYYAYIKDQAALGIRFVKDFPLAWDVIDPEEMFVYPNAERAGLQLADIVASAFYSGVEFPDGGDPNPEFAIALAPRMCPNSSNKQYMHGVKVLPRTKPLSLPTEQQGVFDFYSRR